MCINIDLVRNMSYFLKTIVPALASEEAAWAFLLSLGVRYWRGDPTFQYTLTLYLLHKLFSSFIPHLIGTFYRTFAKLYCRWC